MNILEKTKQHFFELVKGGNTTNQQLLVHVPEVEKWAIKILESNKGTDRKIVLLSVWLHDTGHILGDENTDHAITSEIEVRRFLNEEAIDSDTIDKVAHCVRAHRCRDIQPESIEGKILAAADSASHFTDGVYLYFLREFGKDQAMEKIERDFNEKNSFPEIIKEIEPLYHAWKKLIEVYPSK